MSHMDELVETVRRLRAPGGCPWDREQTHQTLTRCLLEESAELIDTIDELDFNHMREELGDVLLQVVMHAQIAQEEGRFDLEAVAAEINEKLIRRHPHVFGTVKADTSEQVLVNWAAIKEDEKKAKKIEVDPAALKKPPRSLTTLLYADELLKQLGKRNYSPAALDAVRVEKLSANLTEEEAGSKLLELVAACRKAKIDPDAALRKLSQSIVATYEKTPHLRP